jgi:nitrogen fixation protein FixH
MTRSFTGWHMAGLMIAFFAVVIGVNMVMATSAVRTFGGTVVDNSYVASQRFDSWLAHSRAQTQLGWWAAARFDPQGRVILDIAGPHGPLAGKVAVRVEHPLGRQPGRALEMRALGGGRYLAAEPLASGRWVLRIDAAGQGPTARFTQEVRR